MIAAAGRAARSHLYKLAQAIKPSDVFCLHLFRELYYYVSTDGGKLDCTHACRALAINPPTNEAAAPHRAERTLTGTRWAQIDLLDCCVTEIPDKTFINTYQTVVSPLLAGL